MSKQNATLLIEGVTLELPIRHGTMVPSVFDIGSIIKTPIGENGVFSFDPGFTATAACESKITFIDGDKGSPPSRLPD